MSFFKTQVSFPLNFASLFIVMTDNSFKNFLAEALCALDKRPIKVQFVKLLSALMKVYPTSHAILDTSRSGFIQILHHSSLSWKMTSLYFFSWTLIYFGHESKLFRLLTDWLKIHQIHDDIFETIRQFFFKLCIILQCYEK